MYYSRFIYLCFLHCLDCALFSAPITPNLLYNMSFYLSKLISYRTKLYCGGTKPLHLKNSTDIIVLCGYGTFVCIGIGQCRSLH